MKIVKRMVNTKRHTIGYLVGGKWRSRAEVTRLASRGKIDGVTVRTGSNDEQHIASLPYSDETLYDLPYTVEPSGRVSGRRRHR